jgi:superfamily II DNA or RNA helicase
MGRREEIIERISQERAKLNTLTAEEKAVVQRMNALEKELASLPSSDAVAASAAEAPSQPLLPSSNQEKIVLFRSLFRGREDVFPLRWENTKTGKSGYSPACNNEWRKGICQKTRNAKTDRTGSCGDCHSQDFRHVSDDEIARHLRGEQIMGVYPLMPDDTCWFLAVDFDGDEWQNDVGAFRLTCEEHGFQPAVERSRSGNGAHAWFFFAEPLPARLARSLACFFLTETMDSRRALSLRSYDRLFPNQDTLPKGGFGNLIALPLQRKARELGNTLFIDEHFSPLSDQWRLLAGIERLGPKRVAALVTDAAKRSRIIGMPEDFAADGEQAQPPSPQPLSKAPHDEIQFRGSIHSTLANRLFVPKSDLSSSLLSDLKRLASFANPEFYQRQRMRLSTAITPRVITCFEEDGERLAMPRGCVSRATEILAGNGVELRIDDQRNKGIPIDVSFAGELSTIQSEAAQSLMAFDIGVVVAPPGIGKTVIACWLIGQRKRNTLIIVHRQEILAQWIIQLEHFLGIHRKTIGQIGGGKRKRTARLDVAMLQSLIRKGEVDSLVREYGHIIVDECHHCPAFTFERVLSQAQAQYIVGLTATPQRRDGHHPIIEMQLGPTRFLVKLQMERDLSSFQRRLMVRETEFRIGFTDMTNGIQEIYSKLAADEERNDLIFDDVLAALENGRSPILLTERKDHLEHFAERLRHFTRNLVVLHGGMKRKERARALAQIAAIPEGEERLLLATGRYIGEGFDDARLDTMFLALPVSWKGTLVQYAGRLHRKHANKKEVIIYDYWDQYVPVLCKMFEKRLRGYRALGYERQE